MAEDTAQVHQEEAHDDHHEVAPNPDYDGPRQHCLPPEVENSVGRAIVFGVLILLVVLGGWKLGAYLLG